MKQFLILTFVLLLSISSSAQFKEPGSESAQQFKTRKILYVEDFMGNEHERAWFKKHWRFNHDIRFISKETIGKMLKEKRTGELIMTGRKRAETMTSGGHSDQKHVFTIAVYLIEDIKKSEKYNVESKKNEEIFKLSTQGKPTSEAGYKFIGQHFYNFLYNAFGPEDSKDFTPIASKLTVSVKDKTLYIPKSMANGTESVLKAAYGLPLKVVDDAVLEKAIMTNQTNVAYIGVIFSDDLYGIGMIVLSAKDGRPMMEANPKVKKLGFIDSPENPPKGVGFPTGKFTFGEEQAGMLKLEYEKAVKRLAKGK